VSGGTEGSAKNQKLGLGSRTQAALWAVREGLVELDDSGPGSRR